MSKRLIALLAAASFMMTSPALAVKKVPKESKQQANSTNQTGGQDEAAKEEKSFKQDPLPSPDNSRQPVPPSERPRVKEKDRFIDEDSDGINDRMKKPPTVKKKKKENRPKKTETKRRPG